MSDLYVDWSDYHQKIEQLAGKIHDSEWEFDSILCLARGGLRVGDLLSRIYDRPLAILAVSSYRGAGGQEQGQITFSEHLTMTAATLGKRLLLVDDLVDSGVSLERTLQWLAKRYGSQIQEVRTAVLWHKARSIVVPDYYVEFLPDNPWIHQPFEGYEQMNPTQLAAKYERLSIKI